MTAYLAHKNLPNQKKIDWLLADERDFPLHPQRPRCRYLLCSTARCGSNLVGDMLRQTGRAGDPLEYLNKRYIAGIMRKGALSPTTEQVDISTYLDALERVRTSSNGYFGVKAHFEHVGPLLRQRPQEGERLLRRFDCFIQLRRRDKLAQAISLYRARTTQVWSYLDMEFMAPDDPRRSMQVPYDAVQIARALADVSQQEQSWESTLARLALPSSIFWYEDFVTDFASTSAELLRALGLPLDGIQASSRVRKQGQVKDPMIKQFIDEISVRH